MSILTTESSAPLKASNTKVLVADDAEAMRRLLKGILKKLGFEKISETKDGEATVKDLQVNQYDLIICDWEMPGATGDEILKMVRESQNNRDSIFIMCTANSSSDSVKGSIQAGVSNYIVKPLNPKTMSEKLSFYFELNC